MIRYSVRRVDPQGLDTQGLDTKGPRRRTGFLVSSMVFGILVTLALTACQKAEPPPQPIPIVTPQITFTDEENNILIFKNASPATVFITNNQLRRDLFSLNVLEIPQGTGSGFIWSRDGYIVTNGHVVEGANSISVGIGTEVTYKATLVGLAPSLDIALLKIDVSDNPLTPLPLGDSSHLVVGQKVLAIGNPFGLDFTLTTGIISALGREISAPNGRRIRDVVQTDAAINPGNSGGPLLDSTGRVIGVNTAIIGPGGGSAGIGFAVPINSVAKVIPQLIAHGRPIRPVLGISVVRDSIARNMGIQGAIVMAVNRGGGASQAGMIGVQRNMEGRLVIGDVIVAVGSFAVSDSDDLLNALEQFKPGRVVPVTTLREGKQHSFQVRLGRPE